MKIIRPEEARHVPDAVELSADELQQAYELSRASFTAGDLQRYAEANDKEVSGEQILCRLEAQQHHFDETRQSNV